MCTSSAFDRLKVSSQAYHDGNSKNQACSIRSRACAQAYSPYMTSVMDSTQNPNHSLQHVREEYVNPDEHLERDCITEVVALVRLGQVVETRPELVECGSG